jgi:hypothetical protein
MKMQMKMSSIILGSLLSVSLVGCGEGMETGGLEQAPGVEQSGEVGSTQQGLTLAVTSTNWNILRNGCWSGSYLMWNGCNGLYGGSSLDAPYKYSTAVSSGTGTVTADNGNTYLGECVSFVKAVTKNNTTTSGWGKGVNVVANGAVAPGTAIATFLSSTGGYYGHAAIFVGYIKNSSGQITGFNAYSQNWGARAVQYHVINTVTSSGATSDADNYHVITY